MVAVEDTWQNRDLPVLDVIVQASDRGGLVDVRSLDVPGLGLVEIRQAVVALASEDPPFFTGTEGSGASRYETIMGVTGHARRAVRAWPSAESLADRLLAELARAAEAADDEETRTRLQRTVAWFGSAGRDVFVSAMGQAVAVGAIGG